MRDLARQQMRQRLDRTFIFRSLDQRLIGLPRTSFGGDVRAQIPHDIAAFIDVGRGPGRAVAVDEMRPDTFHGKQRRLIHLRLVHPGRMLRDQLADHFEMVEFLDRDVLQHVPDRRVGDVK